MKILFAGDTHGDQMHLRHLTAVAKRNNCNLVFVLGDFGYWEHTDEGAEFLDGVNRHADRNKMPIYFLDGNHDKTSLLLDLYDDDEHRGAHGFLHVRPFVRYARRGLRWEWNGRRFIALGGAYSVDKDWRVRAEARRGKPESLWFPEEEMTDAEMDTILDETKAHWPSGVEVVLAHDKPRASDPQWNRKNLPECLPNQDRLQRAVEVLQPQHFLHGHLHVRYTDILVRVGSGLDDFCMVEGLDCNPEADHGGKEVYRREDSWVVYDTESGRTE